MSLYAGDGLFVEKRERQHDQKSTGLAVRNGISVKVRVMVPYLIGILERGIVVEALVKITTVHLTAFLDKEFAVAGTACRGGH